MSLAERITAVGGNMLTEVAAENGLCWYLVRTKPKQDARAEANLRRWGLETLAPKIVEARSARGDRAAVDRVMPLFPGYVFARFSAAALLVKVRLTRGVQSVIGFGECATPVDEWVIALIRGRIREDGFVHMNDPEPGDEIRITGGPLRSLVGVFERDSARDRVVILLATVGAQARVQVPKASIRMSNRVVG